MDLMISIYDTYLTPKEDAENAVNGHQDLTASHRKQIEPMMEQVHDQRDKLAKEVERWCKERGL